MKKMAIVSSYNELCGNATYTEVLRKEFGKYYNVEVLGLKTNILASNKRNLEKIADKHIDELAHRLKQYDYVNIQFEAGLYGNSRRIILRRIKKLIASCDNLVFTMHRVDIADSFFDRGYLKKLLHGKLFENLKNLRQNLYMAKMYEKIIRYIKRIGRNRNFNIVVHTERERNNIRQLYEYENVYDFPITFLGAEMRKRKPRDDEREAFKEKYGLKTDDIIIGLFGFISAYKGHDTAIKALKLLPKKYKIIIFGSQHPMGVLQNMTVDPYIAILQKIIKKSKLDKRVFFAGSLNDEDFINALYTCDFAVLPYIETNQSGSGIASLVLESKIKSLYSNNKAFFELQKYFPDCFETFDIGNYNEIAYKIRNYNKDYRKQIDKCLEKYNLENNVLFQKSLLEKAV